MKTAPAGQDYIDYWHRKNNACSGVRVWRDRCQALRTSAGPEAFSGVGDPVKLPVRGQLLDSIGPAGWTYLDVKPQVTHEVLLHVSLHPDSDIVAVLTGEKSFDDALKNAEPSYAG
jgi:hypothetical protein